MGAVVYSALIGGYEMPVDQMHAGEFDEDFVMFTDRPKDFIGTKWNTIRVEPRFPTDPVRSARYLKILGHPALKEFERTLWVDNRVALRPSARSLIDLTHEYDLVVPHHSYRPTLRSEFEEVIASGYDDPRRVRDTYRMVCAAGVDMAVRPWWTGILARRQSDEMRFAMQTWMEYLLLGSRRDQLSIRAAVESANLRLNVLPIDNRSSDLHAWVSNRQIQRDVAIQAWRPPRRSIALRVADALRSWEITRRGARLLERAGRPLPTLDTSLADCAAVSTPAPLP